MSGGKQLFSRYRGVQATYQRRFGDRLSPNPSQGRGHATRWLDLIRAAGIFLTRGREGRFLEPQVSSPGRRN